MKKKMRIPKTMKKKRKLKQAQRRSQERKRKKVRVAANAICPAGTFDYRSNLRHSSTMKKKSILRRSSLF